MFFEQVYDKSLAQASYLIGCQQLGEAIVIDPKRDVDTYLALAKANNLKITKIAETHIHADFLSGTPELAKLTGAKVYLSDEGGEDWQYAYPHIGLRNGDLIQLGNIDLHVMHTPGHTPESISFLLIDRAATDQPVMVLTGDFVFVGDVGRPDLLEKAAGVKGSMRTGAEQLYISLQDFDKLPDFVQVWPGHGAGSSCGKALGAVRNSTVGYEKIRNWALQIADRQDFVREVLDHQPEPPTYFAEMKKRNKAERSLLLQVPTIPRLSDEEFATYYHGDAQIVDTRPKANFAEGHLPNTLNIQIDNAFATWCGWMLNYEQPIVLIIDPDKLEHATRMLMRIGMDHVVGYVAKPDFKLAEKETTSSISREDVRKCIGNEQVQILDVRSEDEYEKGHIPGSKHLFVGTLARNLDKIEPQNEIVVYCQSGDRAAIASSLLMREGFKNIQVYFGGMSDWKQNGEQVER